jgi:hypothetical protein
MSELIGSLVAGFILVVGVMIILALLFIFLLVTYVYTYIWVQSRVLRSKLHKSKRIMSLGEARQRIARKEGMILIDLPTLGWNISRVWWAPTADFLPTQEPPSNPSPDEKLASKEEIENYRRFIDPATGSASLIAGFIFGGRIKRYLKKHFELEDCPHIFTAAVLLELQPPKEKKKT